MNPELFPGLSAYDTRALVFGNDRRVVVTHSPNLHAQQSRGFDQTLAKTLRALSELADTLARGKTRRNRNAVLAHITQITRPRWVNMGSTPHQPPPPTDLHVYNSPPR